MSGPKLSKAEIEKRRRLQLEREREERVNRFVRARLDCENAVVEAEKAIKAAWERLDKNVTESWSIETHEKVVGDISRLCEELSENRSLNPESEEECKEAARSYRERVREFNRQTEELIRTASDREKQTSTEKKTVSPLEEQDTVIGLAAGSLGKERAGYFEVADIRFVSSNKQKRLVCVLNEVIEKCSEAVMIDPDLEKALSDTQAEASGYVDKIKTGFGETMDSVLEAEENIQRIVNEAHNLIEEGNRRKRQYSRYRVLCSLTGQKQKEYRDFQNISELESAIAEIETCYKDRDEMRFIAEQLSEAMRDLGYKYVSSHVLTEEGRESDCSIYRADERSCVVIYTGSNGEVMMRVASIDTSDDTSAERDEHKGDTRVSKDLSEEEKKASLEEQISFCAAHPDIVRAALARGIILTKKRYYPPGEENAVKVIIGDNEEEAEETSHRRDKVNGNRKKMS